MSLKKPSKTASLRNNKQVIQDLETVGHAITAGKLDEVFTLKKLASFSGGKYAQMTMSDIDQQIKNVREQKLESIIFAIQQIETFSKYLRKNFHDSSRDNGYDTDMIVHNISDQSFMDLANDILSTFREIDAADKKYQGESIRDVYVMQRVYEKLQYRASQRLGI